MEKALELNNVSIRYMTGDFKSIGLKEFVLRKLTGKYQVTEFWADRHVTFSLEKGDMLGIVGANGAGKSTLLKAVTGIMVPIEGTIKVNGKVAALLELASGFDDDLTVQENTYLRGALLGYTRQFMDEKYEEIIRFAELEEFQEYQFKQLSSGMKSRLAFSIACLVNPDIIILDEVLSVGDGAFKEKSGDRMREILSNGVTGILVSHSVPQVKELCNKVLWLDHGKQIAFGESEAICNAYQYFLWHKKKERVLPKSMEEIEETSRRYKLAYHLAREERDAGVNKELTENESRSMKIRRWMKTIGAMEPETRAELFEKYQVDKKKKRDALDDDEE